MEIDPSGSAGATTSLRPLSGRARVVLQQHQRRVAVLGKDLQGVDRVLAGALAACDGASQHEMLSAYLEAVQELRVSLQRLEGFLMTRLLDPASQPADEDVPVGAAPAPPAAARLDQQPTE